MFLILKVLLTLILVYFLSLAYSLSKYRALAKKIGLPYVLVPFDSKIYPWLIASVPLRDWFKAKLPKALFDSVSLTIYGIVVYVHDCHVGTADLRVDRMGEY